MSAVIEIENLSKQYRLGLVSTRTLSHDLNRWWQINIRGREDPYLKVGETNERGARGLTEYIWALRDINIEIQEGEVLGIIGRNGAGKSTLLKILSKVTTPTTGIVKARGRIASLLEVGTGFHHEMTGRENIFMNGAIMGMTKAEIRRKFDEIVDFAGIERYIDTPVKRYSSGMVVRLGFAVAAFLEPEILVVDEVLAVGDAEFQKKAVGKMQDVSRNEGRTVLFVSHNMTTISNLCNKLCILIDGKLSYNGNVNTGIEKYLLSTASDTRRYAEGLAGMFVLPDDDEFHLLDLQISQNNKQNLEFNTGRPISIEYHYEIKRKVSGLRLGFDLIERTTGITLFRSFHDDGSISIIHEPGTYKIRADIPDNFLKPGAYSINIAIGIHNVRWISFGEISIPVSLHNIDGINKQYADQRPGIIMPLISWINETA